MTLLTTLRAAFRAWIDNMAAADIKRATGREETVIVNRHPYTAEDREDMVCQLIDARIKAIRTDVLIGRQSTVDAVLEHLELDGEEDAAAVLWNALVGGSRAVGVDNAEAVAHAIFQVAEALAESDVADMERHRAESRDDNRIAMAAASRMH